MYTPYRNPDIPSGKGNSFYHLMNPYRDPRCYNTHRDNNGTSYNGIGCLGNSSYVRVPSIKRSKKIWKNFYKMFPRYKEILDECIAGTRTYSCMTDEWVAVEIPNTTHLMILEMRTDSNGNQYEKWRNAFPDEIHNNMVKLKRI